jgi:hypothetical protein
MRPATTAIISTATILLLLLLPSGIATARPLTIEHLLSPYAYLPIESIYDQYAALIDLLISTLIFVGLAQATLAHRYPGTGGRAIAIGVGLGLAISLLLAENTWNFNLKTLGPLAALIIVLILGVMVYQFVRHAGAPATTAASVAYLIMFVTGWAVAQPFFDWLNNELPLLSLALLLGLLASLGGTLYGMLPHANHIPQFLSGGQVHNPRGPRRELRRRALKQERSFTRKTLRPMAKEQVKNADTLQRSLRTLRQAIQQGKNNPQARQGLLEQLRAIPPREHALWQDIHHLKELQERILRFDEALVHESHHNQLHALSPEEKQALAQTLQNEISRAGIDKKIEQIESEIATRTESVARLVEECTRSLEGDETGKALAALDRAISEEQNIRALTRQTKSLEKKLLRLIGHDIWNS